jgi:ubiquinone/menaquinone biosynthesis C-methylase UbiE
MHIQFNSTWYDPYEGTQLNLIVFEQINDNILHGIFINSNSSSCYPLFQGVPIFLKDAFPKDFILKFSNQINDLKRQFPNLIISSQNATNDWSFSLEWQAHGENEMNTTWGMTTSSRVKQFFIETQLSNQEVKSKLVLDAGCGNGLLTEALSEHCNLIIGADYSTSVFQAEKRRTSANCCFIQCDLRYLPFKSGAIDVIVSNGVIHHTKSTSETFAKMADKTALNGSCYIWLYSRKGSLFWQIKRLIFDFLRIIVCRLPESMQKLVVNILTNCIYFLYKISGSSIEKSTLHVDMYDSVTPRWRNYHTPEEVSKWYYEKGFGPVTVSHWDNRYGFGVVAKRVQLNSNGMLTPGENFPNEK